MPIIREYGVWTYPRIGLFGLYGLGWLAWATPGYPQIPLFDPYSEPFLGRLETRICLLRPHVLAISTPRMDLQMDLQIGLFELPSLDWLFEPTPEYPYLTPILSLF